MRELMAVTGALSDKNRVRALCALRGGELCVCQVIELLELAPSTVSKHLSVLKQARLVESRKEGRWMYYRLAGAEAGELVADAIGWVLGATKKDAVMKEDGRRMKGILRENPEELCRRQVGRACCGSTMTRKNVRGNVKGRT